MDIRDQLACILAAEIASKHFEKWEFNGRNCVVLAYGLADLMTEARSMTLEQRLAWPVEGGSDVI